MSKEFYTMQVEIGRNVQDTGSTLQTYIGTFINNRYRDFLRRSNFNAIKDYAFTLSAAQTMVSLPSDFSKEVYVYDATNKRNIPWISLSDLITDYKDVLWSSGSFDRYSIVDTVNSSTVRYKYLKPHYIPSAAVSVQMPYTINPTALTSGAYPIIECDDALVLGGTADAWRYKRQFSKAADYELLYERSVQNHIWNNENQINQIKAFSPSTYSRDTV